MTKTTARQEKAGAPAQASNKLSNYLDFGSANEQHQNLPSLQTLSEETHETQHHLDETQDGHRLLDETLVEQNNLATYLDTTSHSLVECSRSKQLLDETLFEQHVDNSNNNNEAEEHRNNLDETLAELQQLDQTLIESTSFDRSHSLNQTSVHPPPFAADKPNLANQLGPMYEYYRSELPSQVPEILFFINHDGKCDHLDDLLNDLAHALYQCPEPTGQAVLALGVMSSIRKRIDDQNVKQQIQALRVMDAYCRVMNSGKDIPHLVEHCIATSRRFPSNHNLAHLTLRILTHVAPTAPCSQKWFPMLVKSKMIAHAAELIEQWKEDRRLQKDAVKLLSDSTRFLFVTQATFQQAGAIAALESHIAILKNPKGAAYKESHKALDAILSLPLSD